MQSESMPNLLKKRAFLTPDRTALFFNKEELTFKELYERSVTMAGRLQASGLAKGDYTGILLKNHVDTVIILCAFQLSGIRAVILNNRLSPAELVWQLKDSEAKFLITEAAFAPALDNMEWQFPFMTKEELFSVPGVKPLIQEEVDLADVCTVMYTSGTTGHPKGVLQTYGNHWWSAIGSALNLGVTDQDCWLCSVPLFHISGFSILMRGVIYGMPIVLHERFDAEKTMADIRGKKVTIMSAVGTTLKRVIDALGDDRLPSHLRCMLLGGGPAPLPLLQACVEKEIPVFQSFGMTETCSQIVTLAPEYSLIKLGSAGKPLFPSQIKIEASDGKKKEANEAGEIVVKGPNVTKGYLNRPDATKEAIKNGWFYTGDIGYLDEAGFLYVLDRRSDMIISGGENIYPAEIEAVLLAYPGVADAGVTGIADPVWGKVPAAFLVKKPEYPDFAMEEIQQFCQEQLAKYKVPKQFYFVTALPRNAAKKLMRRHLPELIKGGKGE